MHDQTTTNLTNEKKMTDHLTKFAALHLGVRQSPLQ